MTYGNPGSSPNSRFLGTNALAASVPGGSIQGALGVSLLTHALVFLLVVFALSSLPPNEHRSTVISNTPALFAWVPVAGAPHGGGGNGNEQSEPARTAELAGREPLTTLAKTGSSPTDISTQQIQIPTVPMMADARELSGIMPNIAVVSTDSQGPGSGDRAGQGRRSGNGPGDGPGAGPGRDGGMGDDAYQVGNEVVGPRLIKETKPAYTADAMRARIQGVVRLQATVLPDGSVGRVRVLGSLDKTFGLDDAAVTAVKAWRFLPGTLAGRAVPVLVEIELTFTLR